MKVFIGKSKTVWMVSPNSGAVRKLPISMYGLVLWLTVSIIVGIATVSLVVLKSGAGNISYAAQAVKTKFFGSEIERRSHDLDATIAKLQKKHDEAKRLNARVEDRLHHLDGILGNVTEDPKKFSKNSPAKDQKLLKPASFVNEQIRSLKKLDRIEADLRMLPLASPVKNGIITSKFGPRGAVAGEASHFHRGVDISFRGTSNTVYAAGTGIIKQVGVMNGYGLYIDIQHSGNVVTRYAHLAVSQVHDGQKVHMGQVIALGGSTGATTGAHLHYEVEVRGRSRDPEQFLTLPKRLQMVLQPGIPAKG